MNKLRYMTLLLSSCLIVSVTGCTSAIPELTEQEQEQVTQYMADILLKYDASYQDSLLEEEELAIAIEEQRQKEEEARIQAEEQERLEQEKLEASQADDIETTQAEQKAGVEVMADAVGIENIEFDYLGYELCSQYPNHTGEELFFSMVPTTGNVFLVLKFNLANIGSAECDIDMMANGTGFAVKVNDGSYTAVLTTMLENDLSMLMTTIPVESGTEVVLVAQVPEGTEVENITLYVRGQETNQEIQLQ